MNPLIHIANVILLASYTVKDILWLRILVVTAGLLILATYLSQDKWMWEGIAWNLVFFIINVAQIRILILERRPVRMEANEQRLYQQVFRSLKPREFTRLLALGTWEDRLSGDAIVSSGQTLDRIMVIADGKAEVRKGDQAIIELGEGRFIGEMSFLTGQAPGADVRALTKTKLVAWPHADLKRFLESNTELRASMQTVIGTDLVAKLRG